MNPPTSTTRRSAGGGDGKVEVVRPYQQKLSSLFRAYGYEGLRSELLETARVQSERHEKMESWPKLWEFGKVGRYGTRDWLSFYLASMDHGFLKALIDGQIGRRMFEDDAFKYHLDKTHKLKATPQIYVNICSRAEFSAVESSQAFQGLDQAEKRKWAGWGFAPTELRRVLNLMETYVEYKSRNPKAQQRSRDVDALMVVKPGSKLSDHAQDVNRRYLPSGRSIGVIKDWTRKVREKVLRVAQREMEPSQLDQPFPWSFQEVGFGQHGQSRGTMHVYHDGTNYLFGLFTACAMNLYPRIFEIKTHAVMDVFRPEHADACEILGSLCGRTYGQGEWMGLNPAWAGGNSLNRETGLLSDKLAKHFEKNQTDAGHSLVFEKNWKEDKWVQERVSKVCSADLKKLNSNAIELETKVREMEELVRVESLATGAANYQRLTGLLDKNRKLEYEPMGDGPRIKVARKVGLEVGVDADSDAALDEAMWALKG